MKSKLFNTVEEAAEFFSFISKLDENGAILLNPRKLVDPQPEDKILLVGVENFQITPGGDGAQIFDSFKEVKKYFPGIDAQKPSEFFTWSLGYQEVEGERMVRFETWQAKNLYSK